MTKMLYDFTGQTKAGKLFQV